MLTNIKNSRYMAAFLSGLAIGGLSVALYLQTENSRFESEVLTQAVANSAYSYVPTLLAVTEDSVEQQIQQIESTARTQLIAGILLMNANMEYVSDNSRKHFRMILSSVARNREKLRLGQYASPPRDDIEAILVAYSE